VLDPALAARLAAGARARAADFSVDRTVERTLAVYEEVLGRDAGRGTRDAITRGA
jgi:hypothetical protein